MPVVLRLRLLPVGVSYLLCMYCSTQAGNAAYRSQLPIMPVALRLGMLPVGVSYLLCL